MLLMRTAFGLALKTKHCTIFKKKANVAVGYTTAKEVNIHPSKAVALKEAGKTTSSTNENICNTSASSIESDMELYDPKEDEYEAPKGIKKAVKCSTKSAVAMVITCKVSTKNASKICKEMANSGVDIATPSQSGVYKAAIKASQNMKENYKTVLKDEIWCLHFDGKKIGKKEFQAVVLTNEFKEVRVAVMVLNNGKSSTIYEGILEILDKFQLWNSIKMIVCDTTNVNSGKKGGVVSLLQTSLKKNNLPPPQYIGCQHHILDLILKHVMNELLVAKSISPNIAYVIFSELISDYESLKKNFNQSDEKLEMINIKWRDDMQYLYELGQVFKYYQQYSIFPYIKFRVLPSLSTARWHSKAILTILTFILIPAHRKELLPICTFICSAWYDVWFSDQRFRTNDFLNLEMSVRPYEKAHKCLLKHWVRDDSLISNIKRTNICAERAIKVIQEINPYCKNERTLNLKFISSNKKRSD